MYSHRPPSPLHALRSVSSCFSHYTCFLFFVLYLLRMCIYYWLWFVLLDIRVNARQCSLSLRAIRSYYWLSTSLASLVTRSSCSIFILSARLTVPPDVLLPEMPLPLPGWDFGGRPRTSVRWGQPSWSQGQFHWPFIQLVTKNTRSGDTERFSSYNRADRYI